LLFALYGGSCIYACLVYFAPAVLRKDLPRGSRGGLDDIVAVLGAVIDDDGDTGKRAVLPQRVEPSIELTTCVKPSVNRRVHFVFKRGYGARRTTAQEMWW
jgi:hypothetical protein